MDELRILIWEELKGLFPENAEVTQQLPGNLVVMWKLNNDPERPNRQSRPISIRFAQHLIQVMSNETEEEKRRVARGIVRIVNTVLHQGYDPNSKETNGYLVYVDDGATDR